MAKFRALNLSKRGWIITLNSSSYYILSYLVVYLLYQVSTALASGIFNIPSVIYYNRMAFLVKPEAWTFDSVKIIFSAGLVLSLIVGLISLVIYLRTIELDGIIRLFFLWGFIHGINMFVSSIMIGAIIYESAGYVLTWLYLSETTKMLLLFSGIAILLLSGTLMVKPMLFSANSYYNFLSVEDFPLFRWSQFFRPYLISACLILLVRFPVSLFELIILFTPGIILLPLVWMVYHNPDYYFEEKPRNFSVVFIPLIITILLLLFYRIFFASGLRIG